MEHLGVYSLSWKMMLFATIIWSRVAEEQHGSAEGAHILNNLLSLPLAMVQYA